MHSYLLTIQRVMRDRERVVRFHSSRGCAAHAVPPLRLTLTGGAMVPRAYQQRSFMELLLPDADKP